MVPEVANAPELLAKWEAVRSARAKVLKEIETLRAEGKIGSSLAADAVITACGSDWQYLASLGEELRFVMMTSKCELRKAEKDDAELTVTVTPSPRTKCIRCWHYVDGTTEDAEHPGLCPRCRVNLFGAGEKRLYA